MKIVYTFATSIVLAGQAVLASLIGYVLMLGGAALFAPRRTPRRAGGPTHRFAIVIPAHNEERLLPGLLANLRQLAYPADLYSVFVVADNCTDATAELGRSGGAVVYERFNTELVGKGYALEWLLEQIWARTERYDAYVIVDADSVLSHNFLTVMDARLARGEQVIQGYYAVRDPGTSAGAGLRAVALAVLHFLRPQGRMVIGGSAGLKGNGMVFADAVMRKHRWSAALTEDIAYHTELLLAGQRTTFAPDAVVWAEMPTSLAAAQTQNARWEQGRLEMVRTYVPRLLREGVRRRDVMLIDAAVEQIIPPFSVVAAGSLASLVAGALLRSRRSIRAGVGLVLGQGLYIALGLLLSGAPRSVYRGLLFAPVFLVWKIALYIKVLIGNPQQRWIRTQRND